MKIEWEGFGLKETYATNLTCSSCGRHYGLDEKYLCKFCGGILEVNYDYEKLRNQLKRREDIKGNFPGIWKYGKLLPLNGSQGFSLFEGDTPLLRCNRLASELGLKNFFVKDEGRNPTGSFKDRSVTIGISDALKKKLRLVHTASTGNAGVSAAAYSARAGLKAIVLVDWKIPLNKLLQMKVYDPKVIYLKDLFKSQAKLFRALRTIEKRLGSYNIFLWALVNPLLMEGIKTIAYEIVEQLHWIVPDKVVVPVGRGDCIAAIHKGFKELRELGLTDSTPEMIGVQAEKANPLVKSFEKGLSQVEPIKNPETVASGINVGFSGSHALKAIKESNGEAVSVSDKEIIEAQLKIARFEGIFTEVTSAATVAAVEKLQSEGKLGKNEIITCILTGTGLKDMEHLKQTRKIGREMVSEVEEIISSLNAMLKPTKTKETDTSISQGFALQ